MISHNFHVPVGGNGNPLQYPCLGNPMNRGTWWARVHGVTKSQTRLSTNNFHVIYISSNNLIWSIVWYI